MYRMKLKLTVAALLLSLCAYSQNEPQDIQLSSEVLEILKRVRDDQQKNGRPGEYIFDGHNIGQPLKDEGRHWDNIRAEAGLRDFCLHDLRHSFASFMAVTTGSKIMIQQSLRHADPSTSDRYTHLINDPLRVAVGQTSSKIKDVMHGNKIVNKSDTYDENYAPYLCLNEADNTVQYIQPP